MMLTRVIASVSTVATLAAGCGDDGTRVDAGVVADAGREAGSMDRPICDPDQPYIASMKARMSGYRDDAYWRGDHSHANDQIVIGEVRFLRDDVGGQSNPGNPMEGRLLGTNGEVLWARDIGDPLWSEHAPEGLRQTDLTLGVQLLAGGVFYEVFDDVAQKSIVLFDLRPHLQRLCAEQPCLKLCQPPGDAGADDAAPDTLPAD